MQVPEAPSLTLEETLAAESAQLEMGSDVLSQINERFAQGSADDEFDWLPKTVPYDKPSEPQRQQVGICTGNADQFAKLLVGAK